MGWHKPIKPKKRTDLLGRKGRLKQKVTIVDANESFHGVDVKVRDFRGEEFWTSLDNLELDEEKDPA
ncbi:hypothetical protein J31TS6_22830 [Brevibacillus reuszeri]|uniref:hypothetical protein n=1 Tax=Brevibacillus reuszeri TaxID=54915 RepID=UPI001B244C1D|nr:hypothetical protein [Brevibacillus reuszeri]GIO06255.1 hypothetical protein J31TS6_22830 [Brevibacillus reuszeri]